MAAETAQEREERLRQLSANQQRRLAAETAQEREERLRQLSDNQKRRLAAETAQEREERLRQLSDNQQHTLAAETAQEREERLRQLSHNHQCRMEEAIYNSCVAPARHNAEHLSSNNDNDDDNNISYVLAPAYKRLYFIRDVTYISRAHALRANVKPAHRKFKGHENLHRVRTLLLQFLAGRVGPHLTD